MATALQQETPEPIKCFLRLRSSISQQNAINSPKLTIKDRQFVFDDIFNENASQLDVYEKIVEPFLDDCFFGFTHSIITYGQTGTGKTYSMFGCDKTLTNPQDCTGLVPLTVSNIFKRLECMRFLEYLVRISFVEIFNEEIYDLIVNPANHFKGAINNLNETTVGSFAEFTKIFVKGLKCRQADVKTDASLSHAVFSITLYSRNEEEELSPVGKLNFVDLMGLTKENRNGNKSLNTLNRCIQALYDKKMHIPYRESKLTRLLQDSLGGNAKTSFLVTSFNDFNDCAVLKVLEFAQKVREIVNMPKMLRNNIGKSTMFQLLHEQLQKFQNEINAARLKNGIYVKGEEYNKMLNDLAYFKQEYLENNTIIKNLQLQVKQLEECVKNSKNNVHFLKHDYAIVSNELEMCKKEYFEQNIRLAEDGFLVESSFEQEKVLNDFMKLLENSNTDLKIEKNILTHKINQQNDINVNYNDEVNSLLGNVTENWRDFQINLKNNEEKLKNMCNNINGHINDTKNTIKVLENCPDYEKFDNKLECFDLNDLEKNVKIENDLFGTKWTDFMAKISCDEKFFEEIYLGTKNLKISVDKNFDAIENYWKTELMKQQQFNAKIQQIVNEFHLINEIQIKDCNTMRKTIKKSIKNKYNTRKILNKIKIELNETTKQFEIEQKNHIKDFLTNYNTVIYMKMKKLMEKVEKKYEEIGKIASKNKETETHFMKLLLEYIENIFDKLNNDIDDRLAKERAKIEEFNKQMYNKVVNSLENLKGLDKIMEFSQDLLDVTRNEINRYTNDYQKSLTECTNIVKPISNMEVTPPCVEKVKLPSKVQEVTPRAVLKERFYEKVERDELSVSHNDSSILLENCSFLNEDIVNN